MNIVSDNQAAKNITRNPVHHDHTKHIEIDRHFTKEKIESNLVNLSYPPTHHQIADILTKALPQVNFDKLSSKLGLINIYNPTWGAVY